jgi:hypothetical protein
MKGYRVRATYTYPVSSETAESALSTLPFVIKPKFGTYLVDGHAEVLDAGGNVVLRAVLQAAAKPNS